MEVLPRDLHQVPLIFVIAGRQLQQPRCGLRKSPQHGHGMEANRFDVCIPEQLRRTISDIRTHTVQVLRQGLKFKV